MQFDKTKSVAIIYQCAPLSERVIHNSRKLQRRLARAIADMVEDGYSNFVFYLDEKSPFPVDALYAVAEAKLHYPNITMTVMFPYKIEGIAEQKRDESNCMYRSHADHVVYSHRGLNGESDTTEQLLSLTSAVIIYCEYSCSKLHYATHHAQYNGLPLININI